MILLYALILGTPRPVIVAQGGDRPRGSSPRCAGLLPGTASGVTRTPAGTTKRSSGRCSPVAARWTGVCCRCCAVRAVAVTNASIVTHARRLVCFNATSQPPAKMSDTTSSSCTSPPVPTHQSNCDTKTTFCIPSDFQDSHSKSHGFGCFACGGLALTPNFQLTWSVCQHRLKSKPGRICPVRKSASEQLVAYVTGPDSVLASLSASPSWPIRIERSRFIARATRCRGWHGSAKSASNAYLLKKSIVREHSKQQITRGEVLVHHADAVNLQRRTGVLA